VTLGPGLIVALSLATYALIGLVATPMILTRGSWRVHYPRLCLTLWYVLFLTGVGAGVGSGALGVWYGWPAHSDNHLLAEAFGFGAVSWMGPALRVTGAVFGWAALAIAGGLISLVATRTVALVDSQRRIRADVSRLVAGAGYREELVGGTRVTFIASRRLIACGLSGSAVAAADVGRFDGPTRNSSGRGSVIISSELDQTLTRQELQAVIEHERAHLRGAHLLLTRLALLNQACLPSARAARELRRATSLLTELIADDVAARRCGGADLASALTKISERDNDPTLGLRALRIEQRLPAAA
jgi:hypothetical protein